MRDAPGAAVSVPDWIWSEPADVVAVRISALRICRAAQERPGFLVTYGWGSIDGGTAAGFDLAAQAAGVANTSPSKDASAAERMLMDGWTPLGGIVTPSVRAERIHAEAIAFARAMVDWWEATIGGARVLAKRPEASDEAIKVALEAHRRFVVTPDKPHLFAGEWRQAVNLLESEVEP